MKPPLKIRGLCLLTCLLGVAGLLWLAVATWLQPQSPALRVQLLTYTNAPGLLPCAVFGLTNRSPRKVSWVRAYPQVRTGADWSKIDIYGPSPIISDLDRGEGMLVFVPVPPRGDAWRVPLVWSYVPRTEVEFRLCRAANWLRRVGARPVPGWMICYTNFSAEMRLGAN